MTGSAPQHRTIRIRLETYRRLKVLAAQMGVTMVALIDSWVEKNEAARHTSALDSAAAPTERSGSRPDAE